MDAGTICWIPHGTPSASSRRKAEMDWGAKSEARNPKHAPGLNAAVSNVSFGSPETKRDCSTGRVSPQPSANTIRISNFGLLLDFELRISDFHLDAGVVVGRWRP